MSRMLQLAITVMGMLVVQLSADEPKAKKKALSAEAAKLMGNYKIVSGERAGVKIESDRLKEIAVKIAPDVITTYDKDEKEVYAASYEIDTSAKPWRISMIATVAPANGKGTTSEGLIDGDGDTVRLVYALPGGKTPVNFTTGDKHQMLILKKVPSK